MPHLTSRLYCPSTRLCEQGNYTPELFQTNVGGAMAGGDEKQKRLATSIDKLRAR